MCFTSLTCNNMKETIAKWKVYKLSDPSVSGPSVPTGQRGDKCLYAKQWKFRVTKTVGGHYSGKELLSIQELELHAHSEAGEELQPKEPSGKGNYIWGCKPANLFDHDPMAFPLIDNGILEGLGDKLGALLWSFDEPVCIEEFRLQTPRDGWWNCYNKHCGDPVQWVLEAYTADTDYQSEWVPVMTQNTNYAMPIERETFTEWIKVPKVDGSPNPPQVPAPAPALPTSVSEGTWAPFSEENRKCEKASSLEIPEKVTDLAACQATAEALGRSFLNFDVTRNMCFTSLTCNNMKETIAKWKVFKLSDPSPATSSTAAAHWEKFGQTKTKCHRPATVEKHTVDDLSACERLAESEGHAYLSFEPSRLQCFTLSTCGTPKATSLDWEIYHLEQPAPQWGSILGPRTNCERPAGEKPTSAADLAACETKANAQGRKFLSYDSVRKLCAPSITCDSPNNPTAHEWQVYRLD
jgi:hypothetical protein